MYLIGAHSTTPDQTFYWIDGTLLNENEAIVYKDMDVPGTLPSYTVPVDILWYTM